MQAPESSQPWPEVSQGMSVRNLLDHQFGGAPVHSKLGIPQVYYGAAGFLDGGELVNSSTPSPDAACFPKAGVQYLQQRSWSAGQIARAFVCITDDAVDPTPKALVYKAALKDRSSRFCDQLGRVIIEGEDIVFGNIIRGSHIDGNGHGEGSSNVNAPPAPPAAGAHSYIQVGEDSGSASETADKLSAVKINGTVLSGDEEGSRGPLSFLGRTEPGPATAFRYVSCGPDNEESPMATPDVEITVNKLFGKKRIFSGSRALSELFNPKLHDITLIPRKELGGHTFGGSPQLSKLIDVVNSIRDYDWQMPNGTYVSHDCIREMQALYLQPSHIGAVTKVLMCFTDSAPESRDDTPKGMILKGMLEPRPIAYPLWPQLLCGKDPKTGNYSAWHFDRDWDVVFGDEELVEKVKQHSAQVAGKDSSTPVAAPRAVGNLRYVSCGEHDTNFFAKPDLEENVNRLIAQGPASPFHSAFHFNPHCNLRKSAAHGGYLFADRNGTKCWGPLQCDGTGPWPSSFQGVLQGVQPRQLYMREQMFGPLHSKLGVPQAYYGAGLRDGADLVDASPRSSVVQSQSPDAACFPKTGAQYLQQRSYFGGHIARAFVCITDDEDDDTPKALVYKAALLKERTSRFCDPLGRVIIEGEDIVFGNIIGGSHIDGNGHGEDSTNGSAPAPAPAAQAHSYIQIGEKEDSGSASETADKLSAVKIHGTDLSGDEESNRGQLSFLGRTEPGPGTAFRYVSCGPENVKGSMLTPDVESTVNKLFGKKHVFSGSDRLSGLFNATLYDITLNPRKELGGHTFAGSPKLSKLIDVVFSWTEDDNSFTCSHDIQHLVLQPSHIGAVTKVLMCFTDTARESKDDTPKGMLLKGMLEPRPVAGRMDDDHFACGKDPKTGEYSAWHFDRERDVVFGDGELVEKVKQLTHAERSTGKKDSDSPAEGDEDEDAESATDADKKVKQLTHAERSTGKKDSDSPAEGDEDEDAESATDADNYCC